MHWMSLQINGIQTEIMMNNEYVKYVTFFHRVAPDFCARDQAPLPNFSIQIGVPCMYQYVDECRVHRRQCRALHLCVSLSCAHVFIYRRVNGNRQASRLCTVYQKKQSHLNLHVHMWSAHVMQKSKREKTNTTKTRISSDTTCAHVGWASRLTQWGGSLGVVREVLPGSLLGWGISVMYTSSISVPSILQMFTIVSRRPPGSVGPSMTYSLCPYLLESDLVALGGANNVPDTARRLVLYYSVLQ